MDKLTGQDYLLEFAILGCLIANPTHIPTQTLTPTAFRHPALSRLYEMMRALSASGAPVDLISIQASYESEFTDPSFAELLALIAANPYQIQNLPWYTFQLATIEKASLLRDRLLSALTDPIPTGLGLRPYLDDLVAFCGVMGGDSWGGTGFDVVSGIDEVLHAPDKIVTTRINTGLPILDHRLQHGIRDNYLVVLGGLPGVGKTSFAMNLVKNILQDGHHCAVFSFEMRPIDLLTKIIASILCVPIEKIYQKQLSDADYLRAANEVMPIANDATLKMFEAGYSELSRMVNAIRSLVSTDPLLKFVVVDHLHLITVAKSKDALERIETITRTLKLLASELHICILLLSQLTKPDKYREAAPSMSDLRGSGSIAQDADLILMLHRINANAGGGVEVMVLKNRGGAVPVEVALHFDGSMNLFSEARLH